MMIPRLLALALLLLGGCITTVDGPQREPAPPADRVEAHVNLARNYIAQGDVERARRPLERALAVDPEAPTALLLLAQIHQAEGEGELAEATFKRALRNAEGVVEAQVRNNYGSFLYAGGRHRDAVEQLQVAVREPAYPLRAQAFENLGRALLAAGDDAAAEVAFERSVSLSRGQPFAHLELATMNFIRRDIAAAKQHYDRYVALAPQTARSLLLGIDLAEAVDDADTAASHALALRNLFPYSNEYVRYRERSQ